METTLKRLIKNRELRMLIGQYEEINKKIMALSEWPIVFVKFGEYERLHKNLQEKLQEIAVFYYGNRNYFPNEIESEIIKLLNIGLNIQKNFEETKELFRRYKREMA